MRTFIAVLALIATAVCTTCPAADPLCTTTARSHPPYNCGTKGRLRQPAPLGAPCSASTLQGCRETCLANAQCMTFGYAMGNDTCTMYKKDLPHQVYKDRTSNQGVVFYNRRCFTRSCCSEGQQNCSGKCTDTQTDADNCGACGTACSSSTQTCSNGQCEGNCAAQGITCPSDQICDDATASCVCPSGSSDCAGTCVVESSDPNNCGACGNVCPSGLCTSGACVALVCNGNICGLDANKCVNGVCNSPSCVGSVCGAGTDCAGGASTDCGCFENGTGPTGTGDGFCLQDGHCGAPSCSVDSDCALGSICATKTCCGGGQCFQQSDVCRNGNTARALFSVKTTKPKTNSNTRVLPAS